MHDRVSGTERMTKRKSVKKQKKGGTEVRVRKCVNRECNNLGGYLNHPRSLYCSKRCQWREQNLRQGRVKNLRKPGSQSDLLSSSSSSGNSSSERDSSFEGGFSIHSPMSFQHSNSSKVPKYNPLDRSGLRVNVKRYLDCIQDRSLFALCLTKTGHPVVVRLPNEDKRVQTKDGRLPDMDMAVVDLPKSEFQDRRVVPATTKEYTKYSQSLTSTGLSPNEFRITSSDGYGSSQLDQYISQRNAMQGLSFPVASSSSSSSSYSSLGSVGNRSCNQPGGLSIPTTNFEHSMMRSNLSPAFVPKDFGIAPSPRSLPPLNELRVSNEGLNGFKLNAITVPNSVRQSEYNLPPVGAMTKEKMQNLAAQYLSSLSTAQTGNNVGNSRLPKTFIGGSAVANISRQSELGGMKDTYMQKQNNNSPREFDNLDFHHVYKGFRDSQKDHASADVESGGGRRLSFPGPTLEQSY